MHVIYIFTIVKTYITWNWSWIDMGKICIFPFIQDTNNKQMYLKHLYLVSQVDRISGPQYRRQYNIGAWLTQLIKCFSTKYSTLTLKIIVITNRTIKHSFYTKEPFVRLIEYNNYFFSFYWKLKYGMPRS